MLSPWGKGGEANIDTDYCFSLASLGLFQVARNGSYLGFSVKYSHNIAMVKFPEHFKFSFPHILWPHHTDLIECFDRKHIASSLQNGKNEN